MAISAFAFQIRTHNGVVPPVQQLSSGPAVSAPTIKIRWEAGKLTLHAQGATLLEVLRAVSEKTGIEVIGAEGLSARVSTHLDGVDLVPALRELLSDVDYAIAGGATGSLSPRKTRVIIVKPAAGSMRANLAAKANSNTDTAPVAQEQVLAKANELENSENSGQPDEFPKASLPPEPEEGNILFIPDPSEDPGVEPSGDPGPSADEGNGSEPVNTTEPTTNAEPQ